jgi:type II secretory pathway pseudopilin PulG
LKKSFKRIAFTMAEVMIVVVIIGLLALVGMKTITFQRAKYDNKYMTYSAYKALRDGAAELKAAGCWDSDKTNAYCDEVIYLPKIGHNATSRGLCDRLADLYNTSGTVYCTQKATDANVSTATPNFALTNGMKFYNLGDNASSNLFTVYVDIDGTRRSSILDDDIVKFTINDQTGVVLPYYNTIAATSTSYLSTSVGYRDAITNKGVYTWVISNVPMKTAYCAAYGSYPNTTCTINATCQTHACDVVVDEPGQLF